MSVYYLECQFVVKWRMANRACIDCLVKNFVVEWQDFDYRKF